MKNKATPKDITRKRTLTFDQRENVAIQNTQVFNLGISKRRKKNQDAVPYLLIQYTKLVAIFTLTSKSTQICLKLTTTKKIQSFKKNKV